jgi:hypothetical protein
VGSVINTAGVSGPGSLTNRRCIVLEELSGVELLHEPWRTAPNHSGPASCIVDADVDAEDYAVRDDTQQGQ